MIYTHVVLFIIKSVLLWMFASTFIISGDPTSEMDITPNLNFAL